MLRCQLELTQHEGAVFITLTYDEKFLPPTLVKRDLQLWLKRLRKSFGPTRSVRFFASGEYGTKKKRPHYHVILYGATLEDEQLIRQSWGQGITTITKITNRRIAYCAGYTTKKLDDERHSKHERVDPDTGECYTWQPPFIQMSRRPGIGGWARQHTHSWRDTAILDGRKIPVPRFLHDAWLQTATPEQIEKLEAEKNKNKKMKLTNGQALTLEMLRANEKIANAKHTESQRNRPL